MRRTLVGLGMLLCLAAAGAVLWTIRAPEPEARTPQVERSVAPRFISYAEADDAEFSVFIEDNWNLTGIVKVNGSKGIEANGKVQHVGDVSARPVCYLGYGSQVALIVPDYIPPEKEPGETHYFLGVAFFNFPLDDNESEGIHCRPLREGEVLPTTPPAKPATWSK